MLAGIWGSVTTPCPLCEARSPAGRVCGACEGDLLRVLPEGHRRCVQCALILAQDDTCPDCRFLRPAFDRVVAAFDYGFPGDLLIHGLKSQLRFTHAPALARLIVQAVQAQRLVLAPPFIVLPVPAAPSALRHRGFNPAAEIARPLARWLGGDYRTGWLQRHQGARRQKRLGRADRAREAASLYYCGRRLDGCHVVLVDDVMTTGSTLHGAALAVRAAGAVSVNGLVAARTPLLDGDRQPGPATS
ncbi:MAG: ComF family protein [Alcaligenaceae bacterium]|nr:ComF family protein [Alcaligenaceae bacterium]